MMKAPTLEEKVELKNRLNRVLNEIDPKLKAVFINRELSNVPTYRNDYPTGEVFSAIYKILDSVISRYPNAVTRAEAGSCYVRVGVGMNSGSLTLGTLLTLANKPFGGVTVKACPPITDRNEKITVDEVIQARKEYAELNGKLEKLVTFLSDFGAEEY